MATRLAWEGVESIVAEERRRRPLLPTLRSEIEGSMALAAPAGPFTLSTKADRIERLASGELVLIDYKTGAVPARQICPPGVPLSSIKPTRLARRAALAAAASPAGPAPTTSTSRPSNFTNMGNKLFTRLPHRAVHISCIEKLPAEENSRFLDYARNDSDGAVRNSL